MATMHGSTTATRPSALWPRVVSTRPSRKPATPKCRHPIPPKNLSALADDLAQAGRQPRPQSPGRSSSPPSARPSKPSTCRSSNARANSSPAPPGRIRCRPARPSPSAPSIMVEWIRANKPAKLEGLWKAVLPEGGTAPPAEFAADLFWLLHQGHILLFTDDTLVVQEVREQARSGANRNPTKRKSGKPKNPKPKARTNQTPETSAGEEAAEAEASFVESPIVETPVVEAPVVESPVVEARSARRGVSGCRSAVSSKHRKLALMMNSRRIPTPGLTSQHPCDSTSRPASRNGG